jgi:hypothetical protein
MCDRYVKKVLRLFNYVDIHILLWGIYYYGVLFPFHIACNMEWRSIPFIFHKRSQLEEPVHVAKLNHQYVRNVVGARSERCLSVIPSGIYRCSCLPSGIHRTGWCSDNELDLYSGGARFESQTRHWLFWLRIFTLFFSPFRQMLG